MVDTESLRSSKEGSEPSQTLSDHTPLLIEAAAPSSAYESITNSTATDLLSTEENVPIEGDNIPDEERKPKNVFGIISLLLIAVFLSSADASLVITTYAGISSEFGALESAVWLSTSYTLAMCSVQGIVGKLSDIYGRKAVLLLSYMFFAIGSVMT
jgi:hypothetical protein